MTKQNFLMTKQNFLNLSAFFSHVFFFPLIMVTMIDETRSEWIGLGGELVYDIVLWSFLACAAIMLFSDAEYEKRWVNVGRVVFMCFFILSMPMLIGLAIYVFFAFLGGGFHALLYLWKLILVLGFFYFYFRVA